MALVEFTSDLADINSFDQPDRNAEKETSNSSAADAKKRNKFLDIVTSSSIEKRLQTISLVHCSLREF